MGEIKMRGPKGCADSLSYGGRNFSADKRGVFTVPESAREELERHGFQAIEPKTDAEGSQA